jgi:hypothetical protein
MVYFFNFEKEDKKMRQINSVLPLSGFLWIMMGIFIAGYALAGGTPPCISERNIDKSISSAAELTDFSCTFKKYEGAEVLHFNVALKNISSDPQRFRVHIFLDNGKAVGGLIPRTTKGGLVGPDQTASFEYPVNGMTGLPQEIILIVTTVAS